MSSLDIDTPLLKALKLEPTALFILDIGANVGDYTKILAETFPDRMIYAIEPEPNNFNDLLNNTLQYNNVNRYNCAIGDYNGLASLYLNSKDRGMHRLYKSQWWDSNKTEKVPIRKIDDYFNFLSDIDHNKIAFVKIDVEGYEFHVIKGMEKTLLKSDRPPIMMEWHPPSLEEAGTDPKKFYDYMHYKLGYSHPMRVLPTHLLTPLTEAEINDYMMSNDNKKLSGITFFTHQSLDDHTRLLPAVNILWL